ERRRFARQMGQSRQDRLDCRNDIQPRDGLLAKFPDPQTKAVTFGSWILIDIAERDEGTQDPEDHRDSFFELRAELRRSDIAGVVRDQLENAETLFESQK